MKADEAKSVLRVGGKDYAYWRVAALEGVRGGTMDDLPKVVKILLESTLRNQGHAAYRMEHAEALAKWRPGTDGEGGEFPYLPARVLFQDLTGVACVVDLASLRSAMVRRGGDAGAIEPQVPVDLVIDHSVQVDCAGCPEALERNMAKEFERNRERYEFLKWGQGTFKKLRITPPGVGICHQVNLERLASVVRSEGGTAFPDTLVGTDSHTVMVNGLGVLGWGVGGIEAEAAMLGQPIALLKPVVTGVRLRGRLKAGVTATDLALTVTKALRAVGVVGQFVEFFGEGVGALSPADRSVVANMAPEYGATTGYFPVDGETLKYLRMTGRSEEQVALTEAYAKAQGLWGAEGAEYSRTVEIDLGAVEPLVAGPRRPHEGQRLGELKGNFERLLGADAKDGGWGVGAERRGEKAAVAGGEEIGHGSVVLASITSCTNTSNPALLLGAGLVAKAAVERGMKVAGHVKTSLIPGSRAVADYLARAGLLGALEKLGFGVAAFGCGTCIGNSGPLREDIVEAVKSKDLTVAAVLSGNRNFEGRIHACCKANYLCSPGLVVAYALAGRVDIDLEREPVGRGADGREVWLKDLWPSDEAVASLLEEANRPEGYRAAYADVNAHCPQWGGIPCEEGATFRWREDSTYIREAPFLDVEGGAEELKGARALAVFGDFITTDHISPAGSIAAGSPAAKYLEAHGVERGAWNSYGSRRGNHEVMMRGTFANIRLKNRMAGREGGWTTHQPDGAEGAIYDVAMQYKAEGTPAIVLAGKMYGAGSSRDWAAKGPMLLGVRAVIAESFERIHRSNLVEMGVLPLEFAEGENAESLGLDGSETFDLRPEGAFGVRGRHEVTARKPNGRTVKFTVRNRVDTPMEAEYFRAGGILPYVLKDKVGK